MKTSAFYRISTIRNLFIVYFLLAFSQTAVVGQSRPVFCGTRNSSTSTRLELKSAETMWLSRVSRIRTTEELVYVPIAFHIVRKNDASCNVTDGQIKSQVAILNNAFATFDGLAVPV